MKYTYIYKTSDGIRHEDSLNAKSREEAFKTLRARGIRAIKVIASDGSKSNGEVRGIRKRMFFLSLALVTVGVAAVTYVLSGRMNGETPDVVKFRRDGQTLQPAFPLARQEIAGSRARVEMPPSDLFKYKAEKFLARFAEPARPFAAPECDWPRKAEFEDSFKEPIRYGDDELTEHIDLKRIVAGMKREMRAYLIGGGLTSGYIRELIKRQQLETSYRDKADKKLTEMIEEAGRGTAKQYKEAYSYWLQANAFLKSLGIYQLPLPTSLREYQLKLGNDE